MVMLTAVVALPSTYSLLSFLCDLDSYRKWKMDAAKNGRTPLEIADEYERLGMRTYALELRKVIEKMEAAL